MKTASLTYPTQNFIDLAPLAARYEVLTQAVLAYIAAGRFAEVLRCSYKVLRLVRVFTKLEAQNTLWARKLEMLTNTVWRERVLRDLGGMRKLKLWEAARDRVLARGGKPLGAPHPSTVPEPSWLRTPERLVESERLKAHARKCIKAGAAQQPNVYRDRVKMDFDGMFCLPPLPRAVGGTRTTVVYTQNSIVDYRFNGVPFGAVVGFGPAAVWPVEFYAAMGVRDTKIRSPRPCVSLETLVSGPISQVGPQTPEVEIDPVIQRDEWKLGGIPLHVALPPAVYRDLFETPI